jgi:archaellum biogenesis protein FlaJ (TadC family)
VLVAGAEVGWALVIGSILFLPVGIAGILLDRQVKKKDEDIATFLRSTGNVASAVGITTSQALDKLDLRSTANLCDDVKHLRSRLISKLKPDLCWQRFSLETGSETVYRSIKMFNDATRLGGEPSDAGERSALLPMSINFLRAKRTQVSSSFRMLAIGLHVAVVGLLTFVVQVIMAFTDVASSIYYEAVEGVESQAIEIFALNFETIGLLSYLTTPTIIIMAIAVAFAAKTAEGGSRYTIFTYLALTLGITGGGMILVPSIAKGFFTPVTGL